ncbi:hypothetical protein D3C85_1793720 [compost metagenome]
MANKKLSTFLLFCTSFKNTIEKFHRHQCSGHIDGTFARINVAIVSVNNSKNYVQPLLLFGVIATIAQYSIDDALHVVAS